MEKYSQYTWEAFRRLQCCMARVVEAGVQQRQAQLCPWPCALTALSGVVWVGGRDPDYSVGKRRFRAAGTLGVDT